jgi:hypothetical protein
MAREHPMRWTQQQVDAFKARMNASAGVSPRQVPTLTPAGTTERAPKQAKYFNRMTTDLQGVVHDSTKEYRRWQELQLRERAGEITGLRRQVPFALVVNDVLVCSYEADAVYTEGAALIVEDTKSEITRKKREYRIKLKLMQAIHGIQIREV